MSSSASIEDLEAQPAWLLLVSFLGFFSLIKITISMLKWVYTTFLRPPKNLKKYGSWCLITGATDGIGKAFAHQLALHGLNLVLAGRNPGKLTAVSSEIQAKFPSTMIKTLVFDFSSVVLVSDGGITPVVEEAIRGLDVGLLINNVGITYPSARFFHEVDEKVLMDIVRVNVEATTWVTKAVLPAMLERKTGAIVNIGSGASVVVPSHPLYTVYATMPLQKQNILRRKSEGKIFIAKRCFFFSRNGIAGLTNNFGYIDQLSRSMYVEYKQHGIDVQCQVPLYVATNMTSRVATVEKPSLFIPSPEDYAAAAIRQIGYEPRCTPYWTHYLQWCFACFLPHSVLDAWRLSIGINRRANLGLVSSS